MVESALATRFLHVLGMALLLGGSAAVWARLRSAGPPAPLGAAVQYEWLFWGVLAAIVVTGVGNVATFGRGLPGPDSPWGRTFALKLAAVLGLLVGSLVRTALVDRCRSLGDRSLRQVARSRLRVGYAATTLYLVGLLALAEVLAHG